MKKGVEIKQFNKKMDRTHFNCGSTELNDYFHSLVSQHTRKDVTRCFVGLIDGNIAGYYTLSAHSVLHEDMPEEIQKKLPKYPTPCALIGRLAVDINYKGQHLGKYLLLDAFNRCIRLTDDLGVFAIIVDSKEESTDFYLKFGFQKFPNTPSRLFLPIDTIRKADQ